MIIETRGFRSVLWASASGLGLGVALLASSANAQEASADPEVSTVDEVVVTGFRASLTNALNIKRRENGVVDAISAEDIADFPDLNLAKSLQRIPGVAITRRSGEGRQISVRGLGPDYTRVRVNGMEAIATSSGTSNSGNTNTGRGFDFNIFSSDLFSNLVVRKTASAEVEEGSLGATVDLNASKPFDFSEPRLVLSAQASYNDLAEKTTPGVSFLAADRWMDGRLGALVSASYDERHLIEEGANITRWTYGGSNGGWNPASTVPGLTIDQINQTVTASSDPEAAMYHPRIPGYASYDTSSKRLGLSGAVQFQPVDSTIFTLEGLFSDFKGLRLESQLQALGLSRPGAGKPEAIIRTGVLEGNNLVQAQIDNVDFRTQSSRNELNTQFRQLTFIVDHDFSDRMRLNLMAGRSESRYEDPVSTVVTFDRINSQNFIYDFRPRMPGMNLNFDATDPNNWSMVNGLSEIRLRPEKVDNTFTTYKAAGEYDFNDNLTLKVGVEWKEFEYASSAQERVVPTTVSTDIAAGAGIEALSRVFQFDRGLDLPEGSVASWLAPDLEAYIDQYDIYSNTGIWALQENLGTTAAVVEKTTGIYAQLDFRFDAFGMPFRGDVGARYFETKQASGGNTVGASISYVVVDNEYDMVLPSGNLSVDLTEDLVARISAAQTIARPGLGTLTPGGGLEVQGATRSYESGNPFLEPTKSTNVDFSLEWYPQSGSVLALGLFYKDIDTFVQTLRTEAVYNTLGLPDSLLDGTVATPDMVFAVRRPVNSPGGELTGFELNLQYALDFLPGFWSNFGILANYTYVNSDIDYLTSAVPGDPIVSATLIGLSKNAYNGTIYYETERFAVRASISYRDGYLDSVPANDFNSWQGANETTNIDMQVSYNLTEALKLSLEGINLTDEYADLYIDRDNRQNAYTHTGRQFVLGLRYTF